jgi:hypothetical protein
MPLYRDQVTRLTLRQIRASFSPRVFAQMNSVRLELGMWKADVAIVVVKAETCHGGKKRRLISPRCQRVCDVVGCAPGKGWGCSQCLRWRGRAYTPRWARIPEPRPVGPVVRTA